MTAAGVAASASPAGGVERCSLGARARADSMVATAPPARNFFLLEVPGPWVPDTLAAAALPPVVSRFVRDAAAAAEARLVLIRRPGRHPVDGVGERRWAVVAREAGVRWGRWQDAGDLLDVDIAGELGRVVAGHRDDPDGGPLERPLALVCTHGRHDLCCAVEGRPVVASLAADARLDVWECSHLGGDRFAANVLWLPSALLSGGLTAGNAWAVAQAVLSGRVVLEHFRGRCGDSPLAQAAQWQLMRFLGETRPGAVEVLGVLSAAGTSGGGWRPAEAVPLHTGVGLGVVVRHGGQRYRLDLIPSWTQPHHLTCRAVADARMRIFQPVGVPVLF